MKSAATLFALVIASGCIAVPADGDGGGDWNDPQDPGDPKDPGSPDDPPEPEPKPLVLGPAYDVVSVWDLSSMIENEALGAAARELVVELAVDALGVPSFVRDEAIDKVDALIGDTVESEVTDLAAGSQALADFRDDLGETEIVSEWTLEGTTGRERLISMAVETNGVSFSTALDGLDPLAEVGGPLEITGEDADRVVKTYGLAFGAGSLIRPAAEAAVEAAVASFDCDAIAEVVVGTDGELKIGISFASYTVTAGDIAGLCADQIDSLAADVLGMIDYEIGVELGGPITLLDDDGDAIADRIKSADDYAGALFGLPLPVAVALEGLLQ